MVGYVPLFRKTLFAGTPPTLFFFEKTDYLLRFFGNFIHGYLLAGSGWGKSQTLQLLITHILKKAQQGYCGATIIDSSMDMISTLSHLQRFFSPKAKNSLFSRTVYADFAELESQLNLNPFGASQKGQNPTEIERDGNIAVATIGYLIRQIYGASITSKQNGLIKQVARLLSVINRATIHTLREIVQDTDGKELNEPGGKFYPYVQKLPPLSQEFFKNEWPKTGTGGYDKTKDEILSRLWGILANPSFARVISSPNNALDFGDAMQKGKIMFFHTARDHMMEEAGLLGSCIIAMLNRAILQRSAIPPEQRKPHFIFVDESHEYFRNDFETFREMLKQARKMNVFICFAHQDIADLPATLKNTIENNIGTVFISGGSQSASSAWADKLRWKKEEIMHLKRVHKKYGEFALYADGITEKAVKIRIPFGLINRLPAMKTPEGEDTADFKALVQASRDKYGTKTKKLVGSKEPDLNNSPTPPKPRLGKPRLGKVRIEPAPQN